MTLTEFLLARIAEDEAGARAAQVVKQAIAAGAPTSGAVYAWALMLNPPQGAGGGSHHFQPGAPSPARVLAECEAKRRIVEDFTEYAADYQAAPSPFAEGRRHAALLAVTRLAAVYADHPDHREEWKP